MSISPDWGQEVPLPSDQKAGQLPAWVGMLGPHLEPAVLEGVLAGGGHRRRGVLGVLGVGLPVGAAGVVVGVQHLLVARLDGEDSARDGGVGGLVPLRLHVADEALLEAPVRRVGRAVGVELVRPDQLPSARVGGTRVGGRAAGVGRRPPSDRSAAASEVVTGASLPRSTPPSVRGIDASAVPVCPPAPAGPSPPVPPARPPLPAGPSPPVPAGPSPPVPPARPPAPTVPPPVPPPVSPPLPRPCGLGAPVQPRRARPGPRQRQAESSSHGRPVRCARGERARNDEEGIDDIATSARHLASKPGPGLPKRIPLEAAADAVRAPAVAAGVPPSASRSPAARAR